MELALSSKATRGRSKALRKRILWSAGVLVSSLPFLVMGYIAARSSYLSDQHAYYLERALVFLSRRRVELIGFAYPPGPSLLLALWPTPTWATILSALAGGAIAWMLWNHVARTNIPRLAAAAVLVMAMVSPVSIYLATESLGDTASLLLFLLAWTYYLDFTRKGVTASGFKAGFVLSIAFFFSHYALIYAIPYALFTPLFTKEKVKGAHLAASAVVAFPVLGALLAWVYLNWIFAGDPFKFLHTSGSSLFVFGHPEIQAAPMGWEASFRATVNDLLATPFYLAVLVVMFFEAPEGIPVLLSLPFLVILARAQGLFYPRYLAVSTYTVLGIAALPRKADRKLWPLLLAAMILGLAVSSSIPLPDNWMEWQESALGITGTHVPSDGGETRMAALVSRLPDGSVLLDDDLGYRIVARAGTSDPFLVPVDTIFPMAQAEPDLFVTYYLQRVPENGVVPQPPKGFREIFSTRRWILYRNESTPEFSIRRGARPKP